MARDESFAALLRRIDAQIERNVKVLEELRLQRAAVAKLVDASPELPAITKK